MVGLLFMVALLLGFGSQPARAAEAVRIDSINPSCAGVGAQVSIIGIGFGAKNVKITVGDVPAQVVTATGTTATFLVPQGAPPGSTTVTATNPGGHTGNICFQVKGPDVTCRSVNQASLALARGELRAANEAFCCAVPANPSDDRANLYFAVTRIAATALDDPRLAALVRERGSAAIVSVECSPLKLIQREGAQATVVLEAAVCRTRQGGTKMICKDGVLRVDGDDVPFRELTYDGRSRALHTTR